MKYDLDASLAEIERRKNKCLLCRAKRRTVLSGCATALFGFLTLLSFALALPGGNDRLSASPYGAFLLDGNAGAYVLVGVLAFAFGAAFTLMCLSFVRTKRAKSPQKNDRDDQKEED